MRRLSIFDSRLDALDVFLDMTISDENVEPAVKIVIEKETAENQREKAVSSDFRTWGFVDEQTIAFVVIEREHLIGEIRNHHAGKSGAVIVCGCDTHARARDAIFVVGNSRQD